MFQYAFSPDNSKIAVISTYIKDVTFHLYDAYTFQEISVKKITQLSANKSIDNFTIDNVGNLFYNYREANALKIVKQFAGAEKDLVSSVRLKQAYDYGLLKFCHDVKNNQVYLYSVFYEKSKDAKAEGYFSGGFYICRMDSKTMSLVSEKYHGFNKEVLEKIKCGKPDGFINSYSPNLTMLDNSELLLEAYNSSGGSNSRGAGSGSYDMSQKVFYVANEIVVAKLNSTLELSWMNFVPRSIVYTNITNNTESTLEYSRLINSNGVKYIFIEHPKFEQKKINYASCTQCDVPGASAYPKSNVVEYSLDLNGKLDKRVLYFNEEDNWLIPQLYDINAGENKYMVRFRKKKNENFAIINLK